MQLPVLAALHDISPLHGVDAEEAEMLWPRRPSVCSVLMADGGVKCGSQSHRGRRKRGPLGAPPW
jgi:hypothetical protein